MAKVDPRDGYKRRHASLVDEIADHVHLRRDIVEDVLEGFYDIMVERTLNERKFMLKNLFSINAVKAKNGIRKEPHLQLRAKVAEPLRKLFLRMEENPGLDVTRDNWRDLIAANSEKKDESAMDLANFLSEDGEDF